MGTSLINAASSPALSVGTPVGFAGYPFAGPAVQLTPAAAQHTAMTLAAVRKDDDARVPEPRGRTL